MPEVTAEMDDIARDLKPIEQAPIAPAHGIAAIALNMAMKFHNITTVQDGALYQQYKLEGKNMIPLHLDMVFETAIRIEMHLLASSDRIAKIVGDAIAVEVEDEEETPDDVDNIDDTAVDDSEHSSDDPEAAHD